MYYEIFAKKLGKKTDVDLDYILQLCLNGSDFTKEDIKGKSRLRAIVDIRHAFVLVCLKMNDNSVQNYLSLNDIGKFVNRTHASILHAKNKSKITEVKFIVDRVLSELNK